MLKFLLIIGVVSYVLYKVGSFLFRIGAASQQIRNFQEQQRKGFNANPPSAEKNKKRTKFDGGEYIDYEEVK